MHNTYAISVHHLTKSFGNKKAVDNITIQVPQGKIYGFLGPNGSGKTTTIRLICGLLTADAGEGTCLGLNVRTQSELIRPQVGYMTQKFSYWENLSIRENIEFVASMYRLDRFKQRVDSAIEELGLAERQHQLAGTLSGGWKQRLALASCILHEPKLLLLDEPTAGVDPKARREFWDKIHKLAANGLTILVSTHYMDEAERCHAIIYIAYSKIMTQGTVEEVISNAKLTTWIVEGENLMPLQLKLEFNPIISSMAQFGNSLHISSTDAIALKKIVESYSNTSVYNWRLGNTSMEDAFIYYITQAQSGK